jgi:hypothetical protein
MNDIRTVYADMPATVKAYTIYQDGFYTVILNQNLSHAQNLASYEHELRHIMRKDFDDRQTADQLERDAHQ